MANPRSGNSVRLGDMITGLPTSNMGIETVAAGKKNKEISLRKLFQANNQLVTSYVKNSIILLLLFSSLLFTLSFYFFLRLGQLNFIVGGQGVMDGLTTGIFQLISDSKSLITIGIPVMVLLAAYLRKEIILRNKALFIIVSLIVSGSVSYGIKNVVRDDRPYEIDSRIQKLSVAGGYGFPSGHVAETTTLVVACFILWPNLGVLFLGGLWIILMMASRVFLGVHDVYQVFAGGFVGVLCPVLIDRLFFILKRPTHAHNGII